MSGRASRRAIRQVECWQKKLIGDGSLVLAPANFKLATVAVVVVVVVAIAINKRPYSEHCVRPVFF